MQADLESIDWTKIGHHGKASSEEIPDAIQNLVNENGEIEEGSWDILFHGDEIYDSTPYIIPFILKLIPRVNDTEKSSLLHFLGDIAHYAISVDDNLIHKSRTHIRTYDAIERDVPYYLELLNHENQHIRESSAFVLGAFYEKAEYLLERLRQRFEVEQNDDVKAQLIRSMWHLIEMGEKNLEYSGQVTRSITLPKEYTNFFHKILKAADTLSVRLVAAQVIIDIAYPGGLVSEFNPKFYPKPHEAVSPAAEVLIEDYIKYSNNVFDSYTRQAIAYSLSKAGTIYLLKLLNIPSITPPETQWIAKSLLRIAFHERFNENEWIFERVEMLIEKKDICGIQPCLLEKLSERQKNAVRVIVENDKFWELPTHLFSVYCGLPDSRDELRKLIAES